MKRNITAAETDKCNNHQPRRYYGDNERFTHTIFYRT